MHSSVNLNKNSSTVNVVIYPNIFDSIPFSLISSLLKCAPLFFLLGVVLVFFISLCLYHTHAGDQVLLETINSRLFFSGRTGFNYASFCSHACSFRSQG